MTITIEPSNPAWSQHPNPTVGGTPGAHWIACDCGWYVTGKASVREARRSFKMHRQNQYALAVHG